jgi:hypothetical protein
MFQAANVRRTSPERLSIFRTIAFDIEKSQGFRLCLALISL